MIEHQDDIKKAEFFGREEGFYYISNIFTMPKPSKNEKADVKRFMIEGREYTVPLKVINEIHRQDMIDYGKIQTATNVKDVVKKTGNPEQ